MTSSPRRKQSPKNETPRRADGGDETSRFERISIAAYYRAQARGFVPGQAMDDWLTAEAEVDRTAAA